MPHCITLSDEDSWDARRDKLDRLLHFPQPIYVLTGPGTSPGTQYLLVNDAPWTPKVLVALLEELDPRDEAEALWQESEDPHVNGRYSAWLQTWRDRLVISTWS